MGTRSPDRIEEAAVEAISKVEQVDHWERLDDRQPGKTPDWRLTLSDGRVADVEVTSCPDELGLRFFKAGQTKTGHQSNGPTQGFLTSGQSCCRTIALDSPRDRRPNS